MMSGPHIPSDPDLGWLRRVLTVFAKEVRDHSRDRRALLLALIYPLLGPMLVAGGMYFAGKTLQTDFRERAVDVAVIGAEFAPDLIDHMKLGNISIAQAPDNPEEAVRMGRARVVLIVPKTAANQQEFEVTFITNPGRIDNLRATTRLQTAINSFNYERAQAKALAAGLAQNYAAPVTVKRVNVARKANVAVFFYNMMPPLVIFMIFLGGVHLAVDTTVGERERGSLEPLLLAPVERWELLLAKSGAALVFTAITTSVNLVAFKVFLGMIADTSARLLAPPGWDAFAAIFVVSIPLMAIAVAFQMSISVITRSMKEAQIYLGLLPLVPALPGMVMAFSPMMPEGWSVTIPVFGQMLLITQLVAEQQPQLGHVLTASASTLAAAVLVFWLAARGFKREKMFVLG